MRAPERFAAYLLEEPYHPRSNKHSNALLEFLLDDLCSSCAEFRRQAEARTITYELNRKIRAGVSEWNVDLAVGPPASPPPAAENSLRAIVRQQPSAFRLACEAKSIMTEHRKAQRNRQRDLDALHQFLHRYDQNMITAAITVINMARMFRSPLRPASTRHSNPEKLAGDAIQLLRSIPLRSQPSNGPGLEANVVIVIEYDNVSRKRLSRVVAANPAPQPGDPLHWESFLARLCDLYTLRWNR